MDASASPLLHNRGEQNEDEEYNYGAAWNQLYRNGAEAHSSDDDASQAYANTLSDCSRLSDCARSDQEGNTPFGRDPKRERDSRWAQIQIVLLCYLRMLEPMAFYTIFPYIAEMTERVGGVSDADVGFYSGMIESLFSAVQAVVLIFWGSLADRLGYKLMLVCSLASMSVGPVLFGLSTSIWQMALFRCLAGVFSGSNIIIRSMVMMRCTPETQARAFSWYTFADNLALFVGPLLGGALADPVTQYPGVFEGIQVLERYPYALPGFVVGGLCATGAMIAIIWVEDCKPDEGQRKTEEEDIRRPRVLLAKIIRAPGVPAVLGTLMCVRALMSSMVAVSTTMLYTPVAIGGMGYSPREIAMLIAVQGVAECVWLLLVFPWLYHRIGGKGILNVCGVMFPLLFADYALMNLLLRDGSETALIGYWGALVGLVLLGSGVLMASASSQLVLQNMSPDPRSLGTLNALAESFGSVVRTVTPALSTSIFAFGVGKQMLGGHLIWLLLVLASPLLFITTSRIPSVR